MIQTTTYFYLLNAAAKRKTTIMVMLGKKNDRLRVSTGISTVVSDWDKKKRISRTTAINKLLRTINNKVEDYDKECQLMEKEVELAELADIIKCNNNVAPRKRKLFTDYIQMYYDNHKQLKAPNTIKKYITLKNFIIKYEPGATLPDIDAKFAVKLKAYCLDKKELNNTIGKRFQLIRVVLRWCEEMKYISDVNLKHFSHPQTDKIEAIVLTEIEIQKIANVDLNGKQHLESIRDLFLIACYTGVDFVDLPQINKQNLHTTTKGNMYFQIKRSKTSDHNLYSHPPCNKLVFDILEKRNWIFNFISYDKSLQHLKKVCELAELTDEIKLSSNSGKKKITYTQTKYDWIAWKTARRSFIKNLMSDGKQTELVASAVGHTKTSTTAKYQHLKPALMVDLLAGN